MPELPEVETICIGLRASILDSTIRQVELTDFPEVIEPLSIGQFRDLTVTKSISAVGRRGKYVLIRLDDDLTMVIHLRMTGQLVVATFGSESARFQRLGIELDDDLVLQFADQRKFGRVQLLNPDEINSLDRRLGPEPLDELFTEDVLAISLAGRKRPIKSALLDQHIIAGIGNIYADEALFRAGIHPLREAQSLTSNEVECLHSAVRSVLQSAIVNRRTTFSSYLDSDGQSGANQLRLEVYGKGRDQAPCPRCGSILTHLQVAGRTSHVCERCQLPPGAGR